MLGEQETGCKYSTGTGVPYEGCCAVLLCRIGDRADERGRGRRESNVEGSCSVSKNEIE